jgi:UDP-2-acetamido-3-amino-2,3-dideoxy-glucuronate N-acetyltransferase
MSLALVHPTATIDPGCEIGDDTRIWHYSHVMTGARIGSDCTIGQNVFIAGRAVLGDRVKIQNNVSIYDGVVLEDEVFCGPSMVFTNVTSPRSHVSRRDEFESTLVRRGATLGANSTVLCGLSVGRYAFVGAGAVVTRDVADYALVVGNPARQVGWVCECGVKLAGMRLTVSTVACSACAALYRVDAGRPVQRLTRTPVA